jgi:hypothetical protein
MGLRLAILAILGLTAHAHAQSAEAEAMFNEGDKLMAAGKLAEACTAFEASNNMDPRAGTLIRLGECREQNHQLASSWTAYKDALGRVKDPRKRDIATAKVNALEPRLSKLTIVVGDHKVDGLTITRNGKPIDPAIWDRALPVDGGEYEIGATAPGFSQWRTSVSVPNEQGDVKAEVPTLTPSAKPVAPTTSVQPVPTAPAASPTTFTPKRKLAVGAAGLGVASLAVGIVLGLKAKTDRDDAFKLCPDPSTPCADAARADSLTSSGHKLAIGADVAFGVAAVGAIGAAVLWITGKPETIVPTSNGIALVGRF